MGMETSHSVWEPDHKSRIITSGRRAEEPPAWCVGKSLIEGARVAEHDAHEFCTGPRESTELPGTLPQNGWWPDEARDEGQHRGRQHARGHPRQQRHGVFEELVPLLHVGEEPVPRTGR